MDFIKERLPGSKLPGEKVYAAKKPAKQSPHLTNNSIESLKARVKFRLHNENGFGMNELLGIAATLLLAAFIIIPGLRTFAGSVMSELTGWWTGNIAPKIFQTSLIWFPFNNLLFL